MQCCWLPHSGCQFAGGIEPEELVRFRPRVRWIWIGVVSLPLVIFAAKTGALVRFAGSNGPGFTKWWNLQNIYVETMNCFGAALRGRLHGGDHAARKSEADVSPRYWVDVWRLRFLLTWLIFPVALVVLLSLARPLFLGRYFIFCLPAMVISAAAGIARVGRPWVICSLATMLALSVQGTFSYYDHDFDLERDGSEAAMNYILDRPTG